MTAPRRFDIPPLEGFHPEVGLLLSALKDSTREWREELGEVDQATVTWQPYEGAPSIATLLLHIAAVESWWLETTALGIEPDPEEVAKFLDDETNQEEHQWPAPPDEPLAYFLDLHDRVRSRVLERWRTVTDPERLVSKPTWNAELSLRWMLAHVVEHDSYHGGQAVMIANFQRYRGR